MTTTLARDLKKLCARAFDRADWAGDALRRYHSLLKSDGLTAQPLRALYDWMFIPAPTGPNHSCDNKTSRHSGQSRFI